MSKERVGADDVSVEIIERKGFFFDEKLIGLGEFLRFDYLEFLRQHERDFGEFNGERDNVDPKELVQRDDAFQWFAFAHFAQA